MPVALGWNGTGIQSRAHLAGISQLDSAGSVFCLFWAVGFCPPTSFLLHTGVLCQYIIGFLSSYFSE
jgi:hypothetical protein